ncbi:hypothetical protein PHYPSEUDO_000644 [Phytophthora pseudosyringae]|uniref:Uncharacterized protein n=1 Tax=Phytophthora pseudosyringae TaxID=221518 RepID=A0A8T1VXS2_9STRA|nr:hypothetical protein PHYPSEUDO_000644 [Phytophthora pseudosyringae]
MPAGQNGGDIHLAFAMRALRHIRSAVNDAYDGIRRLRQQFRDAEESIRRQAREIDMLTTSLRRIRQGREPVSESDSDTKDDEVWGFHRRADQGYRNSSIT